MKIGISSCLVGMNCTYNGSNHYIQVLQELYAKGEAIVVCPEVLGGLKIPRDPAEIQSRNPLLIQTNKGQDVTHEYCKGAEKALKILMDNHVEVAVLKFRSPSCGSDGVYDGHFSHTLIEGQGIFAQLLEENGIKVFNEKQISEFLKYIRKEDEHGTYFKD